MKTQILVGVGLILAAFCGAKADMNVQNLSQQQMATANYVTPEEAQMIATLENDIRILDNEIKKCEKSKKGWTAATVIGSVGVAATGVAAIAQGVKISETKDKKKEVIAEKTKVEAENKELAKSNKEK